MKAALTAAAVVALLAALPAVGAPSPVAEVAQVISGKQIANNSVTGRDVKNKSLTKKDFRGSVRGRRGPRGPQGPRGLRGPQGANGINGFGVLRYPETVTTFATTETGTTGTACPTGTYPTGGSAWAVDPATDTDQPDVITSQGLSFAPSGVGDGYFATVNNTTAGDVDVVVDVVCANANRVLPSRTRGRHRR